VEPKAEPQEYRVPTHQTREAGDSFLLFAMSASSRSAPMAAARFAGLYFESLSYLGFRAVALHPRLHSAARIRGLKKRDVKPRS
jgi:hypothetical protein